MTFLVFCSSALCGVNWHQLDLSADTFNVRIWRQEHSSSKLIDSKIDFLSDEEDKEFIEQYSCTENDFAISNQIREEEFAEAFSYYKEFAETCLELFKYYDEIYKPKQIEVSMLFKSVSQKFFDQYRYLKHLRELTAQDHPRYEPQQVPVHSVSPKCGTDLFSTERPFSPTPGATQGKAF